MAGWADNSSGVGGPERGPGSRPYRLPSEALRRKGPMARIDAIFKLVKQHGATRQAA